VTLPSHTSAVRRRWAVQAAEEVRRQRERRFPVADPRCVATVGYPEGRVKGEAVLGHHRPIVLYQVPGADADLWICGCVLAEED